MTSSSPLMDPWFPLNRVVSRRHVFEANTNRLTLVPSIHPTKSVDHLRQEASIRQRYASGVDPVDDLRRRLHPSSAALTEDPYETVETHLGWQGLTPQSHAGHQGVCSP